MIRAVSLRPFAAESGFRFEVISCENYCGESGTRTDFPPNTSVFSPRYYNSTNYSHSSTCCSYQKNKGSKPGNDPERSFANREAMDIKVLSLFFRNQ
jgi:hypothetical protein